MIGPHPNSRFHQDVLLAERQLADALARMKSRPMADFDAALLQERIARTPIPMVLAACGEIAAQALTTPILQLAPHQRKAAALTMLKALSDHLQLAIHNAADPRAAGLGPERAADPRAVGLRPEQAEEKVAIG
ncbi:MAG: hypothetical protein ACR650_09660 [Methylocystis sp.]